MSSIGTLLMGEKRIKPSIVNNTPQAWQNLANPLAQAAASQLANPNQYTGPYSAQMGGAEQQALGGVQNASQGVGQYGQGYGALQQQAGFQMNPYANPTGLEQYGLGQVARQAFGQNPMQGQAQNVVGQQMNGIMNPYAGAIGPSQGELGALGQVGQTAFGSNPMQNAFQQQLMQFMQGGGSLASLMNGSSPIAGLLNGNGPMSGLLNGSGPIADLLNGGGPMSAMANGSNPLTDQLIASAQRPILQNFDDQALAARGLYTSAGQQIQGEGSSPFAMASARLAGNTQNALNDAALGVTNQSLQQQLQAAGLQQQGQLQAGGLQQQAAQLQQQGQLQAAGLQQQGQFQGAGLQQQALGMAQNQPGFQLQNQLAGLNAMGLPRTIAQQGLESQQGAFNQMQANQLQGVGLQNNMTNDALQRALSGFQASMQPGQQQQAAYESAANRQLQAGQSLNSADLAAQQANLQSQLQNLQAQGLPRMIAQQGIDAGLGQFNTQQSQLMQLMQQIAAMANPNTTVLPGMEATQGLIQTGVNSFMGGLGGAMGKSDRRVKKDIQRAGAYGETPIYRFRYLWEDDNAPMHVGVMADEVEHIPGAVLRDRDGLAYVDYNKVIAHG